MEFLITISKVTVVLLQMFENLSPLETRSVMKALTSESGPYNFSYKTFQKYWWQARKNNGIKDWGNEENEREEDDDEHNG